MKVICINNGLIYPNNTSAPELEEGKEYTVESEYEAELDGFTFYGYILKEVDAAPNEGFDQRRFVPCDGPDERLIKAYRMTEVSLNGKKIFLHTCFLEFMNRIARDGYHPEWAKRDPE